MRKFFTILITIISTSLLLAGINVKSALAASVRVPILTYHYVGNNPNPKDLQRNALSISPDKFDAQMNWLSKNGYTPITLDTLWAIFGHKTNAPAKPIVITIDDGYIDFYTTAFPIMQKYGFHSVAFIPTGLIGGSYYMNWDQIKELQRTGLVSFEAHSVSHAYLPGLSWNQMYKELGDSKITLQSQINFPVNFIAYPYGATNASVISAAQKAGFVGGAGTWFGRANYPSMNLPRIRVSGAWNLGYFAKVVQP